jgi:hypothetical protein
MNAHAAEFGRRTDIGRHDAHAGRILNVSFSQGYTDIGIFLVGRASRLDFWRKRHGVGLFGGFWSVLRITSGAGDKEYGGGDRRKAHREAS